MSALQAFSSNVSLMCGTGMECDTLMWTKTPPIPHPILLTENTTMHEYWKEEMCAGGGKSRGTPSAV